jgi:uncharacterized protein YprB with RNaseH-like and TPR domain
VIKLQIINSDFTREFNTDIYFSNSNICFIDIETTGLSRTNNYIYLIGILYYNNSKNSWSIKQLFAENKSEEKLILEGFINFINDYDIIITFNGNTFDIPYINQRLILLNIPYEISMDKSYDIYKIVKENRFYLNLESLKLKSLERYLGIFRDDIYTGKECIKFYFNYVKSKDLILRNKILQHNYDDLYYMLDIMKIIDTIKYKKQLLIKIKDKEIVLVIDRINIVGDVFSVNGYIDDKSSVNIRLMHYDSEFNILFYEEGRFEVALDCSQGLISPTSKGYYIDKNKIVLSKEINDSTDYNLPPNILLLKADKDYCLDNIKNLLIRLITYSLNNL